MKKFYLEKISLPFQRTLADVQWFGPTISAVLVATLINVLTDTLSTFGGPLYGWIFIAVLMAVTLIFVITYNRKVANWMSDLGPIEDIPSPKQHEGLIVLFNRRETFKAAVQYHQPVLKHCWLIVTPETQAEAGEVISDFPEVSFSILPISNLYDTQSCYNIVRHVYKKGTYDVGILPRNTIADITGGTKPMTMGMIVACIKSGYPIQHIPTKFDSARQPIGALPPIQIRVERK